MDLGSSRGPPPNNHSGAGLPAAHPGGPLAPPPPGSQGGLPNGPHNPPAPIGSAAAALILAQGGNQVPPPPGNHGPSTTANQQQPPNGDPPNSGHQAGQVRAQSASNGVNSADQMTLLARRMDSLADTMNGLMLALTPLLTQAPNLTGWPLGNNQAAGGVQTPNSGTGTGYVSNQPASAAGAVIPNSGANIGNSQVNNSQPASNSGANTGNLGLFNSGTSAASIQGVNNPIVAPTGPLPAQVRGPPGADQQRPASISFLESRIAGINGLPGFGNPQPRQPLLGGALPSVPGVRPSIYSQPTSSATGPAWASHSTPLGNYAQQGLPNQLASAPLAQPTGAQQAHPIQGIPAFLQPGNQNQPLQSSFAVPASTAQGPLPSPAPFTAPFSGAQGNTAQPVLHTPQHFQATSRLNQKSTNGNGPKGDAYDTEDDVFLPSGSDHGSRSQGRGRARVRGWGREDRAQTRDPDSGPDDPNDEYAENRLTLEKEPKRIEIQEYNSSGKVDFDIWVGKYENVVNHAKNPHSKKRHHRYCLKFLSMYLDSNAYVIWKRSIHRRTNWEELKKELRREFEDPIIRSEWKGNLRAYVWDENKETLHTYCSKVKRYVDTFEDELVDGSKAKLDQYYLRFKSGLPDDYQDQVRMAMPTHKQSIDKAYDVCLRFQATKKSKTSKSDCAAAVTFEDPSMPARVTQNESNIIRLKNRLTKLEQTPQTSQTDSKPQYSSNRYRGSSPGRLQSRGSTSDANSDARSTDRLNRYRNWRKNNRGGHRSGSYGQSSGRDYKSQDQQKSSGQTKSLAAGLDESRVSQTDIESGTEDLNDTVQDYVAFCREEEEQKFAEFCAMTDEARTLANPGNF